MIDDLWFKNAVVYSLDVETFLDDDGDGIGDFAGLTRRVDYLESLGVDCVWLAPFQPSPGRDDGYDISDYYGVDPRYGTLGDFVEFVHAAGSRGIRVLIDLVVNHTSDEHPWFRDARRGPESAYHDWYVWSRRRPPNRHSGMVFPGVQKETWTYAKEARAWYFHRFFDFQPDLNMANPRVREEILRVVGFWLQLGVAGFRVDAVPFVIEEPPRGSVPPKEHFEWLHEIRELLQWRVGDAILLGEANVLPPDARRYFANDQGLHMMFDFFSNQHVFYALASGDVRPLAAALRANARIPPVAQWAHFLRNHDELDLGRLEPGQRQTVFDAFGPEPGMQLYDRGIRRRLAPMLADRRRLELAYSLMFSLPGTPVLRYGDEIGMGDDLRLRERDAVRTPMQWSSGPNGGFSTAEKPVRPVVSGGLYGYETVNVERLRRDSSSLLHWIVRLIRLRKECPEVGRGTWRIVPTRNPHVLALAYAWRGNELLVAHNLAPEACEVAVAIEGERLADLLGDEELAPERGRYRIALDAYGYRWYRIGTPTRR